LQERKKTRYLKPQKRITIVIQAKTLLCHPTPNKPKVTKMNQTKPSKAKQASIMAITAALFAVFFMLSFTVSVPNFTFLYLPIILLAVFPLWFGASGLVGSMIGALIGGAYVEGLGFFSWVEVVTALVIYGLNWLLITRKFSDAKTKKSLAVQSCVHALTLFVGTCVILFQFASLGLFPPEVSAWAYLLPTFALNLPIALVIPPALIRAVSPKLASWGFHPSSISDLRKPKA
jgi:hypothetical protein